MIFKIRINSYQRFNQLDIARVKGMKVLLEPFSGTALLLHKYKIYSVHHQKL